MCLLGMRSSPVAFPKGKAALGIRRAYQQPGLSCASWLSTGFRAVISAVSPLSVGDLVAVSRLAVLTPSHYSSKARRYSRPSFRRVTSIS